LLRNAILKTTFSRGCLLFVRPYFACIRQSVLPPVEPPSDCGGREQNQRQGNGEADAGEAPAQKGGLEERHRYSTDSGRRQENENNAQPGPFHIQGVSDRERDMKTSDRYSCQQNRPAIGQESGSAAQVLFNGLSFDPDIEESNQYENTGQNPEHLPEKGEKVPSEHFSRREACAQGAEHEEAEQRAGARDPWMLF